ncbi:MAG: Flp pilus assembly complex ATPase component TadA [Candidatus Rokubacteria bacterium]|nr:Flp pilus assembly complex ATPase component TadA [Candidatus Rokubacteria bacterium]
MADPAHVEDVRAAIAPPVAHPVGRRLGDLVLAAGLVTQEQLDQAIAEQVRSDERLGAVLNRLGLISEEELIHFLAQQYNVLVVDVLEPPIAAEIVTLVLPAVARKYEVIPVRRTPSSLTLAMVDPTNLSALDEVAFRTGLRVVPAIARPSAVRKAIELHYGQPTESFGDVLSQAEAELAKTERDARRGGPAGIDLHELRASADQIPVVRLVNMFLEEAIRRGASDVHLDPQPATFCVRLRTDGVLHELMTSPKRLEPAVVSRLKIMAELDIAERRLPQDGRIKFRWGSREIDFRVSILPTIFGESISLRVLDKDALKLDLAALGLDAWGLEHLQRAIQRPHGMILITGPTGSGKTTTLYSALGTLNSPELHIVTAEDPVEYNLKGINQVQVNEEIGLTFAAALRSFLRHDPNVILVGEMRDLETAQIAVRAALTGHLVMSTLHTNDSPSTVVRLLDMGLAPFLLASSIHLIVAQRLARTVCAECREPYEVDEGSLVPWGHAPQGLGTCTLSRGKGCSTCNFTGMKGRVALYEVMPVSPEIRELIQRSAPASEIRQLARNQGMRTLRETGLAKVIEGLTTVDEVVRVTSE